ncbi:MAG: response regulator [Geobacter sp.]|nr:response regulator [Geobacter sp.]
MAENIKLLCVDDERNVLRALERIFMDDDYEILTAISGEDGLAVLAENSDVQVVISDFRMPGMNGVEFLRQVCEKYPDTVRIVLSGYADTGAVVSAINEGQIYKFVSKPWSDEELRQTVAKAVEAFSLHRQNRALAAELETLRREMELLKSRMSGAGS